MKPDAQAKLNALRADYEAVVGHPFEPYFLGFGGCAFLRPYPPCLGKSTVEWSRSRPTAPTTPRGSTRRLNRRARDEP